MAELDAVFAPRIVFGFTIARIGLRWVAGAVLRPVAKGVVRGALTLGDGLDALVLELPSVR